MERATAADPRLNRVLVEAGLVSSVSEADRLIKSGGVAFGPDGVSSLETASKPTHRLDAGEYVVRAGKRHKLVTVSG